MHTASETVTYIAFSCLILLATAPQGDVGFIQLRLLCVDPPVFNLIVFLMRNWKSTAAASSAASRRMCNLCFEQSCLLVSEVSTLSEEVEGKLCIAARARRFYVYIGVCVCVCARRGGQFFSLIFVGASTR